MTGEERGSFARLDGHVLADAWRGGPLEQAPGWRGTAGILLVCVVVGFLARGLAFWLSGVVGFDETYYYILGTNLVTGRGYTLNGLPHTAFPPLHPLLVGLAGQLTSRIHWALWLVGAPAGALVVLPVYFLAADIHGRRTGLFAAGAAAVWPSLTLYAVSRLAYAWRLYAGSEPLYVTVFVTAALFLWLTRRRRGWWYAVAAGFFFGLVWLCRSEGPAVFAFLFLWYVADGLVTKRLFKLREVLRAALVPAVALAVFLPFLLYLCSVTDAWTLGSKLQDKTRIRESFWTWIQDGDSRDFMEVHYALNEEGTWMEEPYWGISDWHRRQIADSTAQAETVDVLTDLDWRWLRFAVGMFFARYYPLVPFYGWFLVISGLLVPPFTRARMGWWGFVAANFAPFAIMAVTISCIPRYVMPLMPLFAVGAARGLAGIEGIATRVLDTLAPRRARLLRAFITVACVAVLAGMLYHGYMMNLHGSRLSPRRTELRNQVNERKLSEYLRLQLPEGAPLMCMRPWIAVNAGLDWRVVPLADLRDIIAYGQYHDIRFALLEGWQAQGDGAPEMLSEYLVEDMYYGMRFVLLDLEKGPRLPVRSAGARATGG